MARTEKSKAKSDDTPSEVIEDAEIVEPSKEDDSAETQPDTPAEPEEAPAESPQDTTEDVPDPAPEPEPEVVEETAPPAAPAKSRKMPAFLLGIATAAILAGAGLYFTQDKWSLGPDTAITDALSAKIDAQSDEIAKLSQQVSTLSDELAKTAKSEDLAPLQSGLDKSQGDVAAVSKQMEQVGRRLTDLENRPVADIGASSDAVATYEKQLAAMREMFDKELANIQAVQAEANTTQKATEAQAKAAEQAVAVDRIRAALDSGAPFDDAVTNLKTLGVEIPPALTSVATDGAPSLAILQAEFPAAARAALKASDPVQDETGQVGKMTAFFKAQLGMRSLEPKEGTDPDAILSRAEGALKQGDIKTALSELAALPDPAKAEMAAWVAKATTREDAVNAVAALAATQTE